VRQLRRLIDRLFSLEEINGGERCPTYLYRWQLLKTRWFGVYLHHFVGDDWSLDLHDHPKRFVSIGLWGAYVEQTLKLFHGYAPRTVYRNGQGPAVELPECGIVVDPMLNAPAFDPIHCGRSEHEHVAESTFRAPWIRTFPATHVHRLRLLRACGGCGAPEERPDQHAAGCYIPLMLPRPCWTLVIVLRAVRPWGFWHLGAWIPWRKYVGGEIADRRKSCP